LKIQNAKGKIEEVIRHLVVYVFSQGRTIPNPPNGRRIEAATQCERQDGCGSLKTGPA